MRNNTTVDVSDIMREPKDGMTWTCNIRRMMPQHQVFFLTRPVDKLPQLFISSGVRISPPLFETRKGLCKRAWGIKATRIEDRIFAEHCVSDIFSVMLNLPLACWQPGGGLRRTHTYIHTYSYIHKHRDRRIKLQGRERTGAGSPQSTIKEPVTNVKRA